STASPASPPPTVESRCSCRTRSACSAPSSTPGTRPAGEKTAPGCGSSGTPASLWVSGRPVEGALRSRTPAHFLAGGGAVGAGGGAVAAAAGAALGQARLSAGNQSVPGSAQARSIRSAIRLPHLLGLPTLTGRHLRSGSHE